MKKAQNRPERKVDPLVKKLLPDFYYMPNEEDIEINEIYRLSHGKLPEIIKKILAKRTTEESDIFLRQKGIEIYGHYVETQDNSTVSAPIGMLVCGAHIKGKWQTNLYLVTFKTKRKELEKYSGPHPNLVNLLRPYIE